MKNVETTTKAIIIAVVFALAFALYLLLVGPGVPVVVQESANTMDAVEKNLKKEPIRLETTQNEEEKIQDLTPQTKPPLLPLGAFDEIDLEQESAGIQEGIDLLNNPLQ